ncbi:MAG: hypothetical protein GY793_12000 [Proteobacteria bacterium]|nr:hypothetical protein [Pseudomonadota bacterium]
MIEYILQLLSLLCVLLVYVVSGSVIYAKTGERYKSTPLRSFAVGAGFWVFLVVLFTVFFENVSLKYLWSAYIALTIVGGLSLSKKDVTLACSREFFYQIFVSFLILIPVFLFIKNDQITMWQEFAVYAKSFFTLVDTQYITADVLKYPLAYQLVLLPVSFFVKVDNSIFACFNWVILSFVACEFVRNCGIKVKKKHILFPLGAAFSILVFLNPFGIIKLSLAGDPFIFTCSLALVFAECLFRVGKLPKNLACLPYAFVLMLMSLCSFQGFLLASSLFLVVVVRCLFQYEYMTHKRALGVILLPLFMAFTLCLWKYFLSIKGLGLVSFDWNELSFKKIGLVYNALLIMSKEHLDETFYISVILVAGLYRFRNVKHVSEVIVDKYLFRTVFWVVVIYAGFCLPVFFSQYKYVARASFSLGFESISLLQFIVLMPIGRMVKEEIDRHKLNVPKIVEITILTGLLIGFIMQGHIFSVPQDYRVANVLSIGDYVKQNIEADSKIALVDSKRMVNMYHAVLEFDNGKHKFIPYAVTTLPEGIKNTHEVLAKDDIDYLILHAPNNLHLNKFEYNLDPNFSYIYKLEDDGLRLEKRFENKFYRNTNLII